MDFGYVILFILLSFLSGFGNKRSSIRMIERFGSNAQHHPQRYVTPAPWAQKLFRVENRSIHRYLYFELFLSLFYALLAPINLTICAVTGFAPHIVGTLVIFHTALILIDAIALVVFSILQRHQSSRQAK